MKNPGFILRPKHSTNIIIRLKSLHYNDLIKNDRRKKGESLPQPPCLNVCIYEIVGRNDYECVLDDDEYMIIPWGFTSKRI